MNLPNSPLQLHASKPPTEGEVRRHLPQEKVSETVLTQILGDKKITLPDKLLQVFEHLYSTGVVSSELLQAAREGSFTTGEDIKINIVQ